MTQHPDVARYLAGENLPAPKKRRRKKASRAATWRERQYRRGGQAAK